MNTVNQSTGKITVEYVTQRDARFRYMLLSRLQSDCKYYLDFGNRNPRCLWAGDEAEQIEFMIKLHDSFMEDEKPMWLTMEQIKEYSKANGSNRRITTLQTQMPQQPFNGCAAFAFIFSHFQIYASTITYRHNRGSGQTFHVFYPLPFFSSFGNAFGRLTYHP